MIERVLLRDAVNDMESVRCSESDQETDSVADAIGSVTVALGVRMSDTDRDVVFDVDSDGETVILRESEGERVGEPNVEDGVSENVRVRLPLRLSLGVMDSVSESVGEGVPKVRDSVGDMDDDGVFDAVTSRVGVSDTDSDGECVTDLDGDAVAVRGCVNEGERVGYRLWDMVSDGLSVRVAIGPVSVADQDEEGMRVGVLVGVGIRDSVEDTMLDSEFECVCQEVTDSDALRDGPTPEAVADAVCECSSVGVLVTLLVCV